MYQEYPRENIHLACYQLHNLSALPRRIEQFTRLFPWERERERDIIYPAFPWIRRILQLLRLRPIRGRNSTAPFPSSHVYRELMPCECRVCDKHERKLNATRCCYRRGEGGGGREFHLSVINFAKRRHYARRGAAVNANDAWQETRLGANAIVCTTHTHTHTRACRNANVNAIPRRLSPPADIIEAKEIIWQTLGR